MTIVKCPRCDGRGYVRGPVNPFLAVVTLGISALIELSETSECPTCQGRCYLTEDVK